MTALESGRGSLRRGEASRVVTDDRGQGRLRVESRGLISSRWTAAFGAERKLEYAVACFWFCPIPTIRGVAKIGRVGWILSWVRAQRFPHCHSAHHDVPGSRPLFTGPIGVE